MQYVFRVVEIYMVPGIMNITHIVIMPVFIYFSFKFSCLEIAFFER